MRQQWNDRVFDGRTKQAALTGPALECVLAIPDQELVEVGVGADHRQVPGPRLEGDAVGCHAIFDVGAEKPGKYSIAVSPQVGEPHMNRHQPAARELPANPQQGGHPEFDLMPVGMPTHTHVFQGHADILAVEKGQRDALVHDGAVSGCALQGFAQRVGRGEHVIEQSDQAQIGVLREVEAEQVVGERIGNEVEEFDLLADRKTRLPVLDLVIREARLLQERIEVNTQTLGMRISQA